MGIARWWERVVWLAMVVALAGCSGAPRVMERVRPEVSLDGASLGAASAAVTMVVFEDFSCGNCKKTHGEMAPLVDSYGDRVRFVFKPFVNAALREGYDVHGHSSHRAASAAMAADRQGRFAAMAGKLFENQYRFSDGELERYAREIGLDVARFNRDRRSEAVLAQVDGFLKEARALGVVRTPTVIVGDERLEGRQTREALEGALLRALGGGVRARTLEEPVRVPEGVRLDEMIFMSRKTIPPRAATPKLRVGDAAPEFELPSFSGERVRLSDFRGKNTVVLSFVPAAFTPVCSGQWPAYAALKEELDRLGVVVLGVTEDNVPSQYAWVKAMGDINFPVLSDFWPHGKVASAYGVLRPDTGTSERAVFVIDKTGMIRHLEVYEIDEQPPVDELMEVLRGMR